MGTDGIVKAGRENRGDHTRLVVAGKQRVVL